VGHDKISRASSRI